ncbi:MAG TPA: hypothetical protein VG165_07020 [Solirubrobacteraceae bacterium]|jgi:hypothetical protein|nr:hypothetical protein [Solirubrobacteraceae bacterium]
MTWTDQLADELDRRGMPARRRAAIVLELEDHIACDPASVSRLGDPAELAVEFTDELATQTAKSGAWAAFGALALAAVALAVSQLALGAAGGYPGYDHGFSVALAVPAILCLFVASQVALVAGTLAALRALRRRRETVLPAREVQLLRRGTWVGLGAGLACSVGLELYVVNFLAVEPAWWLALVGALAGLAIVALGAAGVRLHASGGLLVEASGPSGDIYDDLTALRFLRDRPWRLCAIVAGGVGLAMTLFVWHAERSLEEGLQRGIFEGLAAAVGFVLLGRAIGARS